MEKEQKPIGEVTHYYGKLGVAIVKFNKDVKSGTKLHYKGASTDFKESADSMQFDHAEVETAKSGQEVGIKVKDKVREGDSVFEAE